MKKLRLLILLGLMACAHQSERSDNSRMPAAADVNSVQTGAVSDINGLFLWDHRYDYPEPAQPLFQRSEADYDRQVEKGNLCLGQIKRELEILKQDSDVQYLCHRFKAVNDATTGKETVCMIGVQYFDGWYGRETTGFFAAPYTADRASLDRYGTKFSTDKIWYDHTYVFELMNYKVLDKDSWATALAQNKCHFDRTEVLTKMEAYVTTAEAALKKANGKIQAKAMLEKQEAEQAACLSDFNKLKSSIETEVTRVESYVPHDWWTADDAQQMQTAKRIAGVNPSAEDCASMSARLAKLQKRLVEINASRAPHSG